MALRNSSLALWLLVAALSPAAAFGQTATHAENHPLAAEPQLIKGCLFQWRPYTYQENGIQLGIVVDLLRELESPLNLRFEMRFMPLPRCVAQVREGRIDFTPYVGSDYDTVVRNSLPVIYHVAGMVVAGNSHHQRFEQMTQFNGEVVGILRGTPMMEQLRQYSAVQWEPRSSGDSMWQMLIGNRLDGAVGDLMFVSSLEVYRSGQIRFLLPPIEILPLQMGVRPELADLLPRLDAELQRMVDDGRLAAIYRRHSALDFDSLRKLSTAANRASNSPVE